MIASIICICMINKSNTVLYCSLALTDIFAFSIQLLLLVPNRINGELCFDREINKKIV